MIFIWHSLLKHNKRREVALFSPLWRIYYLPGMRTNTIRKRTKLKIPNEARAQVASKMHHKTKCIVITPRDIDNFCAQFTLSDIPLAHTKRSKLGTFLLHTVSLLDRLPLFQCNDELWFNLFFLSFLLCISHVGAHSFPFLLLRWTLSNWIFFIDFIAKVHCTNTQKYVLKWREHKRQKDRKRMIWQTWYAIQKLSVFNAARGSDTFMVGCDEA